MNAEITQSKKKLNKKLILAGIIFMILLLCIGFIFFKGYDKATLKYETKIDELEAEIEQLKNGANFIDPITKTINLSTIKSKMTNIGELTSQEFLYTNAGKFSDPKEIGNIKLPFAFTTKSFVAKWDGSIKAGIDLADVTITTDETSKKIVVNMPNAKILSHEIDDESFEALDEKNGLFNPIEITDYKEFESACKTEMEERAIEKGLLKKATTNAQDIICNLINTDPVAHQEYEIVFEIIE